MQSLALAPLLLSLVLAIGLLSFAVRGAMGRARMSLAAVLFVSGGVAWTLIPAAAYFYSLSATEEVPMRDILAYWTITNHFGRHVYFWIGDSLFWTLATLTLRRFALKSFLAKAFSLVVVVQAYTTFQVASDFLMARLSRPAYSLPPASELLQEILRGQSQGLQLWIWMTTMLLLFWLTLRWSRDPSMRTKRSAAHLSGIGGMFMSKRENQSTRLLCASVLFHAGARRSLLDWLKDKNRAVALELGVDLELAARVARFADKRQRKATWIYFGLLCASLLAALVNPLLAIVGVIASALVFFLRTIEERDQFAPMFWSDNFKAETIRARFQAPLEPQDVNSLPRSDQNFFVFGDFTPFVGAGQDLGGWSVVIALDKPRVDFGVIHEIHSFAVHDVYDAIDAGLDHLQVKNIDKTDAFFARGTDVRGDRDLLPDIYGRPVQNLPPNIAGRYIFRDDEKVRHYRCYRITDWGGELALSYYIRCSCRGNTLFIETKRFILTPLEEQYRAVDSMLPMRMSETILALAGSLAVGPVFMLMSPFQLLGRMQMAVNDVLGGQEGHVRQQIERTPLFNYGAKTSLRQSLSSGYYGHYFQKMDGDLYNKLFEHEVLDSLVDFLNAHGVDTSELKERQTTILNNGVMVQGGDVNAESLAVGAGARAVKKNQGMASQPAAAGSKQ
jgi:hypothetical protein